MGGSGNIMAKAFVTGGTGFLGRNLINLLDQSGWTVRALARDAEAARKVIGDGVEIVPGDVTDAASVKAAITPDMDAVFHVAADTSSWSREAARQRRVNVDGTAHVIAAVQAAGCGRLVHVSSISVFGPQHASFDETAPYAEAPTNYARTKRDGERLVRAAVADGLDAVIVNPTHIVGRFDSHNWARLFTMQAAGKLPGVPPGGGNFANGGAVAEGLIAAHAEGKRGENYILGGPKASFRELLTEAAKLMDLPPPGRATPAFLLRALGGAGTIWTALTGKRPMVTPEEAAFACETMDARADKAVRELGYRIVPLAESVAESIGWLRAAGLLSIRR